MQIGAFVPVRLSSSRLPGKALLPIAGRPAIGHVIDRISRSRHVTPDRIVICTTEDAEDDRLVSAVEALGARVFRGSRDDLIDRLYRAVNVFGFDAVIQVDGDDPCADPQYMDLAMDHLLANDALGIVVCEGLPFGTASKAIRASAIRTVWEHHVTERNDTGYSYYFTRTGLCEVGRVTAAPAHRLDTARLTLDYPQDLAFFRALFDNLYVPGQVFGLEDIVSLLRRKPALLELNAGLDELYWKRTRELAQMEYRVNGTTYKVKV